MRPATKKLTIGMVYDPGIRALTQDEADAWLRRTVAYFMDEYNCDRTEAVRQIKTNLAYYVGYFDTNVQKRVHELYKLSER